MKMKPTANTWRAADAVGEDAGGPEHEQQRHFVPGRQVAGNLALLGGGDLQVDVEDVGRADRDEGQQADGREGAVQQRAEVGPADAVGQLDEPELPGDGGCRVRLTAPPIQTKT